MEKVKILCSGLKGTYKDEGITLEVLYNIIIEKLEISKEKATFSLFESHGLVAYFEYFEKDIEFILSKATFEENVLYYITIKYREDSIGSLDQVDLNEDVLYKLKIKIKDIIEGIYENIYWQKDTQNEKILSYLYFKVHEIENRFKHLISDYMIRKYGEEWFKTILNNSFYVTHQANVTWLKKSKYTVFRNIRTEMLEFKNVDLIKMLKETRIEGRLIWETEKFDTIFGHDIELILSEISHMRKFIDNSKPVCKELSEDILNITEKIFLRFNNAEHIINRKLKSQEQKDIIQHIREEKSSSNIGSAYVYEDEFIEEQYIIQELSYREDIKTFFKLLKTYKEDLKTQIQEIKENHKDVFNYIDSNKVEDAKQKLKTMNEVVHFGDVFSKERFEKYISIMKDEKGIELMKNELEEITRQKVTKIADLIGQISIFKIEELEERKVVELVDLAGNFLKIEVENWFAQSMEKKDTVLLITEHNGSRVSEYDGKIEVTYLDYDFMHESVNKPLWPDEINVDIEKLTKYVESFKQKNGELFNEIMVKLNKVKK